MWATEHCSLRTAVFGLLVIITAFLIPHRAAAEAGYIDHTSSLTDYTRTVAALNREAAVLAGRGEGSGEETLHAVLCRTKGGAPDLDGLYPVYTVAGPNHCYTIYFCTGEQAEEAAEKLAAQPGMRYAQCDVLVRAVSADAEPAYSFHSWAAPLMGFDSYLAYASGWGSGSATVAVIDSGTCPHSLISPRMLDGGYDYIDDDDDPTNDLFGHGTAVAGIIVDCTPGMPVYILPIRVLNSGGSGKMSNVVNGVREAIQRRVDVINLSLESPVMSPALDDAIAEALNAGITVVAAAGNSGVNTSEVCPAHLQLPGMIVVGGAEYNAGAVSRSTYSNYGSSVDVYAFGTGVRCCSRSGGYVGGTGTSYAAPHITALCALLHTLHPGISPSAVEARIRASADAEAAVPVPALSAMIPQSMGMRLTSLTMSVGDLLTLPDIALPATAMETINLAISDESVASCVQGVLTAIGPGSCTISASCPGLDEMTFEVCVTEASAGTLMLPEALTAIGDEAFMAAELVGHVIIPEGATHLGSRVFDGCTALRTVTLPDSLKEIGENSFSDAVLICPRESTALTYAVEHEMQYVITAD